MGQSGIGRRREAALADGGEEYLQRRKEILQAAARIFKKQGYASTTFADIADVLETDRASLYYYFQSKRALFHEVVVGATEANVQRAEAIRDAETPTPEKLRRLCSSLMESYAEHYPYLYVYIQEDMNNLNDGSPSAEYLNDLNHRYQRAVVEILEQGHANGSLRHVAPAQLIAYGLLGMLNWTHRWFNPEGERSAREIGQAYAEMILKGLEA